MIHEIQMYQAVCDGCGKSKRIEVVSTGDGVDDYLARSGWVYLSVENPARKHYVMDDSYAPRPPARVRRLFCQACKSAQVK